MQVNYQTFIDRMINRYEGGYGWNKKDPGGPTKYGITCYDLAEHRHQPMTSMSDWAEAVKNMPLTEAEDIYRDKYAKAIVFGSLPSGVDCCMMDYAVNSGYARANRVASALVGIPAVTHMTDELLAAVKKADPKWFVNAMCQERLHFMHGIRNGDAWAEFGGGWQKRVDDLDVYCIAVINKDTRPAAPDLTTVPTPKAVHPPAPAASTATATVTTAGGAAGAAHVLGIQPWEITLGIMGVIAIGFAIHEWRQKQVNDANAKVVLPPGIAPAKV